MGVAGAHAAAAAGAGGRAARADGPYGCVHLRPPALLRRAARRRRPRRPCGVPGVPRAGRAARGGGDVHAVRDGVPRRRAAPWTLTAPTATLHAVDPRFTRDDVRRIFSPGAFHAGRGVGAAPPARGAGLDQFRIDVADLGWVARARRAGRAGGRTIVDLAAGRYPTLPLVDVAADSVSFAVPHDGDGHCRRSPSVTAAGTPSRRPGRPRRRRHRPCDVRQLRHPGPQRSLRHTGRRLPAAPQLHPAHHARRGRELQQPARQRGELGRRRLRVHDRRAPPLRHPADVGDERRPGHPARPRLPGRRRGHAARRRGRPARAGRRRVRRPPPALLHAPGRTSTPSGSAPGSWRRCSARPGPSTTRTSGSRRARTTSPGRCGRRAWSTSSSTRAPGRARCPRGRRRPGQHRDRARQAGDGCAARRAVDELAVRLAGPAQRHEGAVHRQGDEGRPVRRRRATPRTAASPPQTIRCKLLELASAPVVHARQPGRLQRRRGQGERQRLVRRRLRHPRREQLPLPGRAVVAGHPPVGRGRDHGRPRPTPTSSASWTCCGPATPTSRSSGGCPTRPPTATTTGWPTTPGTPPGPARPRPGSGRRCAPSRTAPSRRIERRARPTDPDDADELLLLARLYFLMCLHESQWSKRPRIEPGHDGFDHCENFVAAESLQLRNAHVYLAARHWARWARDGGTGAHRDDGPVVAAVAEAGVPRPDAAVVAARAGGAAVGPRPADQRRALQRARAGGRSTATAAGSRSCSRWSAAGRSR